MGKVITAYIDTVTREMVMELEPSDPREVIIEGMLFGVQSRIIGGFEGLLKNGHITQEEYDKSMEECGHVDDFRPDLKANYGLFTVFDFTISDLDEYLNLYTERLKPYKKADKNGIAVMEEKIGQVKKYLIDRFSNLQPYTGMSGYHDVNALTRGSIVFAHTYDPSQAPKFLYLDFGLTKLTVPYGSAAYEDEARGSNSSKGDAIKRGSCMDSDPDSEKKRIKITAA